MRNNSMNRDDWNLAIHEVIALVTQAMDRLDALGAPADIGALLDQVVHRLHGSCR